MPHESAVRQHEPAMKYIDEFRDGALARTLASKIAAQVKLIKITAAHAPYRIHFRNGMAETFDCGADSDERHALPLVDPHCDRWQELGN